MIQYRKPSGNRHIRPQCPYLGLDSGRDLRCIEKEFELSNVWA